MQVRRCHAGFMKKQFNCFVATFKYMDSQRLNQLASLWASKGFLTQLPAINLHFKNKTIHECVLKLLSDILERLADQHLQTSEDEQQQMVAGLLCLPVDPADWPQLLGYSNAHKTHLAVIIYLYFVILCTSSFAKFPTHLPALCNFLTSQTSTPSSALLKALWLVFAVWSLSQARGGRWKQQEAAGRLLVHWVKSTPLTSVYTHHPAILLWTFSPLVTNRVLQINVMILWLKDGGERSLKEIENLILRNIDASICLLLKLFADNSQQLIFLYFKPQPLLTMLASLELIVVASPGFESGISQLEPALANGNRHGRQKQDGGNKKEGGPGMGPFVIIGTILLPDERMYIENEIVSELGNYYFLQRTLCRLTRPFSLKHASSHHKIDCRNLDQPLSRIPIAYWNHPCEALGQMPNESIYRDWLQKVEQLSAGFLRSKLIVDNQYTVEWEVLCCCPKDVIHRAVTLLRTVLDRDKSEGRLEMRPHVWSRLPQTLSELTTSHFQDRVWNTGCLVYIACKAIPVIPDLVLMLQISHQVKKIFSKSIVDTTASHILHAELFKLVHIIIVTTTKVKDYRVMKMYLQDSALLQALLISLSSDNKFVTIPALRLLSQLQYLQKQYNVQMTSSIYLTGEVLLQLMSSPSGDVMFYSLDLFSRLCMSSEIKPVVTLNKDMANNIVLALSLDFQGATVRDHNPRAMKKTLQSWLQDKAFYTLDELYSWNDEPD
ncbi:hypothetical protein J6590_073255 [Homalodisca vitripennis]|nr:hypothetical protein J6590_073255 [Homalodisca vitripennis]